MRFGRKRNEPDPESEAEQALDAALSAIERGEVPDYSQGPYDLAVEAERNGFVHLPDHLDFESILLPPTGGIPLFARHAEGADSEIVSLVLDHEDGELELAVTSSGGTPGMWAEVRASILAEVHDQGGTGAERQGPFGVEVYGHVPLTTEDGEQTSWRARVVGFEGPDWFLRCLFQDALADSPELARPYEDLVRRVFVRGNPAVPAGEPMPLIPPAG